jgi:hypothetical protein
MADQLQLRGGTTAEHATFTGALREVTVDTDKDTVVVHDNATTGGYPLLREDMSNLPAGTIVNADINASAAIAGTKISPDFGSQNVVTTGTATAASLNPTGSSVPTNGVYLPAANSVAISTNGAGRLFVDANGRVLAGTSTARNVGESFQVSTSAQVFVDMPAADLTAFTGVLNRNDANGPRFVFGKSRGTTVGSSTIVQNGDQLGLIRFAGADGVDLETPAAEIACEVDGTPGANDMPGRLIFRLTPDGAAFPTERLRLTSDGRLGLGTSSPSSKLYVSESSTLSPSLTYGATASATILGADVELACGLDATAPFSYWLQTRDSTNTARALVINPLGGNVGIGTTSPDEKLVVVQDGATVNLKLGNLISGATGANYANISKITTSNDLVFTASTGAAVSVNTIFNRNANAESARIDSSGRLLIGTSSGRDNFFNTAFLTSTLQVEDSTHPVISCTKNSNDAFAPYLVLAKTRGTGNTIVNSGDSIGSVSFQGNDGAEFVPAAEIIAQVDGTPGADDMPGRLVFSTTADGASNPTERMRIKNNGTINFSNVATYADNTAALAGGLVAGDVYRKSDGTLMITY